MAKFADADFVKFQKRCPEESVRKDIQDKPHPNALFAHGKTYLEHRKRLELSIEQHAELKEYCDNLGIGYASSVWDVTSAREIIAIHPAFIKVPSPCNNHWKLLEVLNKEYQGQVHISTGMASEQEKFLLKLYVNDSFASRAVIYHCTSEYPCPFEHLYLNEILELKKMFPKSTIGFSNHGKGIAADIAAYMLGATWIERHFVDDRTIRHTDASFSLEPAGLAKLRRDLTIVRKSVQSKQEMSDEELAQRDKLRMIDD